MKIRVFLVILITRVIRLKKTKKKGKKKNYIKKKKKTTTENITIKINIFLQDDDWHKKIRIQYPRYEIYQLAGLRF